MQHVFARALARRGRIVRGDRVDDRAVLDAHRVHEVTAPRLVAARDAHALAQVLLQKAEQQAELRVAGGLADRAVERQVFGNAVPEPATFALAGLALLAMAATRRRA